METLQSIVSFILDLGPGVFVPLIMIAIGLIARMKAKDAVSSGITLGVAFTGMGLLIGFMMGAIEPAAQALAARTGISLTVVDGGWTSMSTLSWAWPYAFLMFPLQLIINGLLIAFKMVKTLNVDMWNVWGKIFTAVLVIGVTGNIPLAFAFAAVQIVVELYVSDWIQPAVEEVSGIPGVSVPHAMMIICVILNPIDLLLRQIPAFNRTFDAATLKDKIGVFGENHVMGFLIGFLLGLAAGYSVGESLVLGIQAGTALMLFPMIAKLFMQALSPLSDAIGETMKKRFEGREIFIGLDWPILAGSAELWVSAIVLVPFTLILAFILPGNEILPFAGIINLGLAAPMLIVTGGNLIRMIVSSIIVTPVFLYVATFISGTVTDLANSTGAIALEEGQRLSWSTVEFPFFRYMFTQLAQFNALGIIMLIVWSVLFFWFYKTFKTRYSTEETFSPNAQKELVK